MKLGTLRIVFFLPALVLLAQNNTSVPPEYRFRANETVRYQLNIRNTVEDYDAQKDQTRRGSIQRTFVIREQLQVPAAGTGPATIALQMENVTFDGDKPSGAMWDAVNSSTALVRVERNGRISDLSLSGVSVNREGVQLVWEEATAYLTLVLHRQGATAIVPWETDIPVKFLGGILGGQMSYIPAKLDPIGTEIVQGEHCLRVRISFLKQPSFEIDNQSSVRFTPDLRLEHIEGEVLYSIDKQNIVQYHAKMRTEFRGSMNGQLVDDNKMDFDFTLSRIQ